MIQRIRECVDVVYDSLAGERTREGEAMSKQARRRKGGRRRLNRRIEIQEVKKDKK
jgi:hypothetical protein